MIMRVLLLACAVCVNIVGSYGSEHRDGVGAFAFQDSTGNRYGGTYGLKDGRVVDQKGDFPPDFSPPDFSPPQFPEFDDFFPEYFRNLENLLQDALPFYQPTFIRPPFIRRPIPTYGPINRTFVSSVDQHLAYGAASKAYDLTSNQAGYIPNFASRFQFPYAHNFGGFGGFENMPGQQNFPGVPEFQMPDFGQGGSSAFASAAAGPGFSRQMAGINPANPNNPNINTVNMGSGGPGFKVVSSSSQASESIGPDGKKTATRRAQTTVNENGKITTYNVRN